MKQLKKKQNLYLMLLSLGGFVVLSFLILEKKEEPIRKVSFKKVSASHHVWKKARANIAVRLFTDTEIRAVEMPFTVKAEIIFPQPVKNISLKWKIPEGVEIISGKAEEEISLETAVTKYSYEVTFKVLNKQDHRIRLKVRDNHGLQGLSFFYTQSHEQKEKEKQELYKRNLEYTKGKGKKGYFRK